MKKEVNKRPRTRQVPTVPQNSPLQAELGEMLEESTRAKLYRLPDEISARHLAELKQSEPLIERTLAWVVEAGSILAATARRLPFPGKRWIANFIGPGDPMEKINPLKKAA